MLNWGAYFIKDYVKSLKTARGAIVRDPVEAPALLAEMAEYRGEIEGGICVRRVEEFALNSEQRYFVINGKAYSADENAGIPMLVETCAEKVPSNFFSVDIARRSDGVLRVVEIGDGQVSDIVGWTANSFARMWASVS
ncbi:MAG TPA: ATP-grasp domain-containing protein [Planctomycetota bacterium]|nr:ATP-grasp domain-containing protein [Planctomycetota bacterium]